MTLGKLLCRLGIHKWRDTWRRDETAGQRFAAICSRCKKGDAGFRLLWSKTDSMEIS